MTTPNPALRSPERLEWDARDQGFLLETSADFSSTRQLETVLERLSQRILEVVPASRSGILLMEDEETVLLAAGYEARWLKRSQASGRKLRLEHYPEMRRVRETGEPLVINDASTDPLMAPVREQVRSSGLHSLLCVPLQTPDRFLGILTIGQFDEPRSFSEREVSLCRTIANQAAIGLENARLYEELRDMNRKLETTVQHRTTKLTRSLQQMAVINDIIHRVAVSVHPEELSKRAVELLRESFDLYAVLLAFHDEQEDQFRIIASCAQEPLQQELNDLEQGLDEGICGHVVHSGDSYLTGDAKKDPYFLATALHDTRSELCVPLRIGSRVVGVLDIQSDEPNAFGEEDRVALEALADTLGVAVRTAELFAHAERARAFMDAVIDNLTGGLIVTDRSGVVRRTNVRAREILGVGEDELEGIRLTKSLPEAAPLLSYDPDASGRELLVQRRDGRHVPLGFSNSFFASREGNMEAVLISFQDLSEVKALQAQVRHRERLATIGQVATAVAHEVRNPLFGITSTAQTLAREHEDEATQELIRSLMSETRRLDGLVDQLLTYGRPQLPQFRDGDLAAVCRELVGLQEDGARERGVDLEVELPESLPARFDPGQVKGAILNLLRNALDAASGKVRMALVSEGEHASIEIEDDGPGVPASERDKVFELYFTTKGGSGSGMGLPICRKVARDHGGDVVCEAASLGGARFRMCLPLTSAAW